MGLVSVLLVASALAGAAQEPVSAPDTCATKVVSIESKTRRCEGGPVQQETRPASIQEERSTGDATDDQKRRGIYFDDGLWFGVPRIDLRMRLGGEVQLDGVTHSTEVGSEELRSRIAFRRARVELRGFWGSRWRFRFRADAVNDDPPWLKDAYIEFLVPRLDAYLRTGRFSSRFGLEKGASSRDYVFMEPALSNAFVPPQETGVLLHRQGPEGNWDVGLTSASTELSNCLVCDVQGLVTRYSHGFDLGTRGQLVHLGINWARRWPRDANATRLRSRPESFLSPVLVDTGVLPADRVDVLLLEGAFRSGPLLLMGEFGIARVALPSRDESPQFESAYVLAAYTLTGESREYVRASGAFRRPRPARRAFASGGGFGALEIAVRLSTLDLNDKRVAGGRLRDLSLGLNWYPTDAYRVTLNAIRAKRDDLDPIWILQARLQWVL